MDTGKIIVVNSAKSTTTTTFRNPTQPIPNVFKRVPRYIKLLSCSIPKSNVYTSVVGTQNSGLKVSTNGTTWTTVRVPPSIPASCPDFDGAADLVSGTASDLNFGASAFTFACWCRRDTVADSNLVIFQFRLSLTESVFQVRQVSSANGNGKRVGFDAYEGASWAYTYTNADVFSDLYWHHIAITRSGTTVLFYIDGALVASTGTTKATLGTSAANDFYIGAKTSTAYWDGGIYDVRIYSGALTAAQVHQVYNDTYTSTPLHQWKLNEGTGATATIIDYGSGATNGTGTSLSWYANHLVLYSNAELALHVAAALNYQASALGITFTCTFSSSKFTIGGNSAFYLSFDVDRSIGNLMGWSDLITQSTSTTSHVSKRLIITFTSYSRTNDEDYFYITSSNLIKGRDAGAIGLDNHFNTQKTISHIPYTVADNYRTPDEEPSQTLSYSNFLATLTPLFETKSTTVSTQFEIKLSSGFNIQETFAYFWTAKFLIY